MRHVISQLMRRWRPAGDYVHHLVLAKSRMTVNLTSDEWEIKPGFNLPPPPPPPHNNNNENEWRGTPPHFGLPLVFPAKFPKKLLLPGWGGPVCVREPPK